MDHIAKHFGTEDTWVAILDDDDEWLDHHLQTCVDLTNENTDAIVSGIQTILDGEELPYSPLGNLEVSDFLSGNPGWEGSNSFCRLDRLLEVGGLPENLICIHDRDLAIRLLSLEGFKVTNSSTVSACRKYKTIFELP